MSIFCDTDTPEYVQQDCGVERAGIVAVVLIDTAVGTPSDANLASASYWNNLINQSPPLAYRILKTRGEYPRPTVTSEEGFGRESKQNTGAEHVINWEVEGIDDNRDFFESANRKKWKAGYVTAADLLYFVDEPTTVDGRIVNPKDIKAAAYWAVENSWSTLDNPRIIDVSNISTFDE